MGDGFFFQVRARGAGECLASGRCEQAARQTFGDPETERLELEKNHDLANFGVSAGFFLGPPPFFLGARI